MVVLIANHGSFVKPDPQNNSIQGAEGCLGVIATFQSISAAAGILSPNTALDYWDIRSQSHLTHSYKVAKHLPIKFTYSTNHLHSSYSTQVFPESSVSVLFNNKKKLAGFSCHIHGMRIVAEQHCGIKHRWPPIFILPMACVARKRPMSKGL